MYDIKIGNIKRGKYFYFIFIVVGFIFIFADIFFFVGFNILNSISLPGMKEEVSFFTFFPFLFALVPSIFIIMGILNVIKINKRVKQVENLNIVGRLYKNIPYTLKPSGMSVNNIEIMMPVVNFKMPNGKLLTLTGDPRHDLVDKDADGHIDLVIDPDNYDNYFLDYDINRLGGNRSEDFYKTMEEINLEAMNKTPEVAKYEYPDEFSFGNYNNYDKLNNKK